MVSTYARRKRNGKLMWYNIGQFCPKCGNHVTLPLEQIHENMDLNEEEKAEYCNVN